MEENEILRVQATLCQCHLLRSDFSIPERTEAVPSYGSGKADIILTRGEGRDEGLPNTQRDSSHFALTSQSVSLNANPNQSPKRESACSC